MKMFELLPRPLGSIFRKLTHLTCNSPAKECPIWLGAPSISCKDTATCQHLCIAHILTYMCLAPTGAYHERAAACCAAYRRWNGASAF